jgi:bifunctional enzyme CysN/CysC
VTALERELRLGQRPVTVLVTGLSKTGKTAIANAVERRLFDMGRLATVLDGQDFRLGMSRDLGFTASDRSENMRRAAEAAKLINDAGVICLAAFVVPHEQVRSRARDVVGGERFLEVYLKAPIAVLKTRDPEGMYAAAERGELPSFPGVTSEFEDPLAADLTLDTAELDIDACAVRIIDLLQARGVIR